MNTIGNIFRLTTFGESHGNAIGGIIDGTPAGFEIDINQIQHELERRRPGQSNITSQRGESDEVQFLSGIFEGKTTGTPIGFIILNKDQHSSDYDELRNVFRPSHADYSYALKYGHRDYRGGGRSSARETACRVVGGAVAKQILTTLGINIWAFSSQIGNKHIPEDLDMYISDAINSIELTKKITSLKSISESNTVRCPDVYTAVQMENLIKEVKNEGDTIGGVVSCIVTGMLPGIGEPVYDKLQAKLAYAMMSINAAKGFEYGSGFNCVSYKGSEMLDSFRKLNEDPIMPLTNKGGELPNLGTRSNHSGGIQGGISNGEPIFFRVGFKPVATLLKKIDTFNQRGEEVKLKVRGRHDPCVVPRAVPVVEAMAAMCILDSYLESKAI